jgi:cell division protein FtsB
MLPSVLKKAFWIFGLAFFLLILFLPGYTRLQDLREKNKDLEAKLKHLNIENTLLQQELKRADGDPVYQEKVAREKMGVVRKGEIPIKIVPQERKK